MPLLQNSICVAKLPQIQASSVEETVNGLTQLFAHSSSNISQIHMPELGTDNMFCLIKFHHYSYMVEFLHKHKSSKGPNKFEIYEAHQILSWFEQETLEEDKQEYFNLVKKGLLKMAEKTAEEATEAIKDSKIRLEQLSREAQPAGLPQALARAEPSSIQITQQVFTDKLLITKSQSGQVKSVTRDLSDERFHLDQVDFSDESWSYNSKVLLQFNRLEFIELVQ